jgi:hypothetical protein
VRREGDSRSRSDSCRDVARRVARALDAHRRPLEALARAVARTAARSPSGELTEAALEPLVGSIERVILSRKLLAGHGFVAAPETVEGRERYLLWLQRSAGGTRRLRPNFDLGDVDVYDYLTMDWYTAARDRRAPVVCGPYLDYSGADLFVLTMTVPVVAGDRFIGVAGADLLVREVEDWLVHELAAVGGEAMIVSAERTVIAANSPRWAPGERLRRLPTEDWRAYRDVASVGRWGGGVLARAAR